MRNSIIIILLAFLGNSCLKETLNPINNNKILLMQIDFDSFTFEGGKEFGYFDSLSPKNLPLEALVISPNPSGSLDVTYEKDTIFSGSMVMNGTGFRNFPAEFDPVVHYYPVDFIINMPDTADFQVAYNDFYLPQDIPYNQIWDAVNQLRIVNDYMIQNTSGAKIGLFLYRPSQGGANPGDWKWYLVLKN